MMKVLLDGQPLPDAPNLREGLRSAIDHADALGRIVVEALGDGKPLSEAQLADPDLALGVTAELRLTSADPRPLVARTLREGVEVLQRVRAEQERAAAALQSGRMEEALGLLGGVLGAWQNVRDVLEGAMGVLRIDLAEVEVTIARRGKREPSTAAARAEALAGLLRRARECVQGEDWSALADLVGFDLDVESKAWEGMLGELAGLIEREAGPR
ncbi:MAG: hypothetical protein FJ255_11660 [Phycisphaerae bacterium]|nr:hypothetical protein [Phycisphaerae bacterium]